MQTRTINKIAHSSTPEPVKANILASEIKDGFGEVKFTGQVLPTAKKVTYEIDFKRVINRKLVMGLADGRVLVDGKEIYVAKDLKVGLFQDTSAF